MGLKTILKNALKRLNRKEKAILRHDDVLAEFLHIGVPIEQIVDKINAFDWLDISEAKTEDEMTAIIMRLFGQFNFKYTKAYELIVLKAFTHKFLKAVEYLKGGIEEVAQSYNVEGTTRGFQNPTVNKFYYINYWADKKNIPVNYNDKRQENRALFNLDTIIISILADKLNLLNEFERNKVKK